MNSSETRTNWLPLLFVGLLAIALGVIPRLVVLLVGESSPWTPFLYQYSFGGLVFATGLWVIRKSGACDFDRPGDRYWFNAMIFGYFWYAGMHALLIVLSLAIPFKGEGMG